MTSGFKLNTNATSCTHTMASKSVTIVALLGLAAMGGFGTLGAGFQDGLFGAITATTGVTGARGAIFPGGPKPYRQSYTGIGAIDNTLVTLIAFFTFGIDDPAKTWDFSFVYWYLMAHFGSGMCLMLLEGYRKGNSGRVASW